MSFKSSLHHSVIPCLKPFPWVTAAGWSNCHSGGVGTPGVLNPSVSWEHLELSPSVSWEQLSSVLELSALLSSGDANLSLVGTHRDSPRQRCPSSPSSAPGKGSSPPWTGSSAALQVPACFQRVISEDSTTCVGAKLFSAELISLFMHL